MSGAFPLNSKCLKCGKDAHFDNKCKIKHDKRDDSSENRINKMDHIDIVSCSSVSSVDSDVDLISRCFDTNHVSSSESSSSLDTLKHPEANSSIISDYTTSDSIDELIAKENRKRKSQDLLGEKGKAKKGAISPPRKRSFYPLPRPPMRKTSGERAPMRKRSGERVSMRKISFPQLTNQKDDSNSNSDSDSISISSTSSSTSDEE